MGYSKTHTPMRSMKGCGLGRETRLRPPEYSDDEADADSVALQEVTKVSLDP